MTQIEKRPPSAPLEAVEKVLIGGDLSKLTVEQKLQYYNAVCQSVGLNPLTQPFSYITLNAKLVLYATKSCTDQLRQVHKISVNIVSREKIGDVYVVTARAKTPDGREDESTGVVSIGKAYGDQLANLFMKAETKAKRRVTLSICGLGLLDESEVETIPGVRRIPHEPEVSANPVAPIEMHGELAQGQIDENIQNDLEEGSRIASEYSIPFGKYKGQSLDQVDPADLYSYCKFIENKARADGKSITGVVADFITRARDFLESENDRTEQSAKEEFPDIPF